MTIAFNIITTSFKDSRRFIYTIIVLKFLEYSITFSQHQYSSFSIIQELQLRRGTQNLLTGDFNGDGVADLAAYSSKSLSTIIAIEDSIQWEIKHYRMVSEIKHLAVGDFNQNGISDLAYIGQQNNDLRIYLCQSDTILYKWKYNLTEEFDIIQVADINNDGKMDILLCGKRFLGITAFLGRGDGTFKHPQNILSDYSFSHISVSDYNHDELPDIFAINWVSNEVLYFSAYAKMKYSCPSAITFIDEPAKIIPGNLNGDEKIDFVMTFQEKKQLHTFIGDGLGSFTIHQIIELSDLPDKIYLNDLDNSGSVDLLFFSRSKKYISLWLKDSLGFFMEKAVFSAGVKPHDFEIFRHRYTLFFDMALTDIQNNKIRFVQNSFIPIEKSNELKFISGLEPTSLIAYPINYNTVPDLFCANYGYNSISYLKNKGDGTYEGIVNLKIAEKYPWLIKVFNREKQWFTLLTYHQNPSTISITDFNSANYSYSNYSLSTISNIDILNMQLSANNNFMKFVVAGYDPPSKYFELSYYEQISKTRFIESDLTSTVSSQSLGFFLKDLNKDGIDDYLYFQDNSNNKITLCATFMSGNKKAIRQKYYFSIADTNKGKYLFFLNDLNNNKRDDLIIYSVENKELLLSLNQGDTTFLLPHQRISTVRLNYRNDIQFADIDNDKQMDIVIANRHTKTLQAYIGRGDGSFSLPNRLMSIEGVSSFVISDFDNDGVFDYAMTYNTEGYIKIIYGQK